MPSQRRLCRVASLYLCEESGLSAKICACLISLSFHCPEAIKVLLAGSEVVLYRLLSSFHVLAIAEHGCICSRAKALLPRRGYIVCFTSPHSTVSRGSPQLSTSAVQASIVSGMAFVCLQASPNCRSNVIFFAVTCELAACQMPVGLQQGRLRHP